MAKENLVLTHRCSIGWWELSGGKKPNANQVGQLAGWFLEAQRHDIVVLLSYPLPAAFLHSPQDRLRNRWFCVIRNKRQWYLTRQDNLPAKPRLILVDCEPGRRFVDS